MAAAWQIGSASGHAPHRRVRTRKEMSRVEFFTASGGLLLQFYDQTAIFTGSGVSTL
jgi:hypothetical protein